jgi:hypothetical protein
MDRKGVLRGVGLGVAALALNVAIAFLLVWVYSIAIAPGHAPAFYSAFAERAAPISGIVAGFFLLMAAGYLNAARSRDHLAGLVPAGAYILLDALLTALAPAGPALWLTGLSYASKLAAGWLGGRLAMRRRQ